MSRGRPTIGVRYGRTLIIDGVIYRSSRGGSYNRWQAEVLDSAGLYVFDERVPAGSFATMHECHDAIRELHFRRSGVVPLGAAVQHVEAWAAQQRLVAATLRRTRAVLSDVLSREDGSTETLRSYSGLLEAVTNTLDVVSSSEWRMEWKKR